ncbi:MAG: CBS domain-containing protein [Planctomycetaceae bacterium]
MDQTLQTLLEQKSPEVYSIQTTQSVYEAINEMNTRCVGALIVMQGTEVAGIISERDYLRNVMLKGRSSKNTSVAKIMTRELVSVTPQHTIRQAMQLMTQARCRHLPVFEDAQLVGILSIGDLVKAVIADQEMQIQILQHYVSSIATG